MHRERECVRDAHERDHDRQREEHVDDREQLVDLGVDRRDVLVSVADVGRGVPGGDGLHRVAATLDADTGSEPDEDSEVARLGRVREPRHVGDDEIAEHAAVLVDRGDAESLPRSVGEGGRDRGPDPPAVVICVPARHGQRAGVDRSQRTALHLQVDEAAERGRVGRGDLLVAAVEADHPEPEGGGLPHLGESRHVTRRAAGSSGSRSASRR